MADELTVDVDERGVMLVTFNRPEVMNALNDKVTRGLLEAVNRASEDDAVRVMVLTGAGRAFCAGAEVAGGGRDPTAIASATSRHRKLDRDGGSVPAVETFGRCDVPIVAAVNGAAAGAGFGIALCCDIRFMAESARMGPIFIKRGLASDYGASYWLPRIVGLARAYEIFYDGALVEAPRALELGLVNRVLPDDRLLEEALAYAGRIAAGPPLAYTTVRRLMQRSLDTGMHDFLQFEWTTQVNLLSTSDTAEGFRAFVERREPQFTGE